MNSENILLRIHRSLNDFSLQQQNSFFLFLQADYLHEKPLTPQMRTHLEFLARELIRIQDTRVPLEIQINGNVRFEKQFRTVTDKLSELIDLFEFWEQLRGSPAFEFEKIKSIKTKSKTAKKDLEKLLKFTNAIQVKNDSDFTLAGELAEHLYFNIYDSKALYHTILDQAHHHYTQAYLIRSFRLQLELKANEHIFKHASKGSIQVLEFTKEYIASFQNPTLILYHCVLNLWQRPTLVQFENAVKSYLWATSSIHTDDALLLGNHLITLLNQAYEQTGDLTYLQLMFKLFEFFRLQIDIFWEYFKEPLFFTNALAVATKVNQYNWAKDFYETTKNRFTSPEHTETLTLGKARMELFNGNYELAKDLLFRTISTYGRPPLVTIMVHLCFGILYLQRLYDCIILLQEKDFTDEARLRTINLEKDALDIKLKAFYQALYREEVLTIDRAQSYFNFITTVRNIKQFILRETQTQTDVEALLCEVQNVAPLASKGTLLEFIRTRLLNAK